jgi:hypothetical protein
MNGHVAGKVVTFVDDVQVNAGISKANCWHVYHQFVGRIQILGMQNALENFALGRPKLVQGHRQAQSLGSTRNLLPIP